MSRIIDQSELGIVADTLIKESNAKITSLCAMYGPIDAFRDDPGLAGAAWSALKSQMNDHYLVIKSLILAYGYVVDDATVLKGIIGGEVELLDEAQIRSSIDLYNANIAIFESRNAGIRMTLNTLMGQEPHFRSHLDWQISQNDRMIEHNINLRTEVEKKLARLLEVQIGTSQLFLRARGAFTIANTAISEVGGAWNGSGFTTGTGSWRTGVETAFRDEDRGTMIRLSARGVTREQIDNMSGLGYSPQDLLEIFKSFGTEEDIQFFLYLMNLDGDSFAKAFAINPESLSDVMRLVLADYSLRLVTFEPDGSVRDTTLLEKFNNALLSAEHSNRNVQDGRLFRDIYLDMLYDGTAYLFYTTAINLAFIDFSASIYNELYIEMWHMYRSQHAMRNLWATQRILISEISRHTVNFESINAREMSMSNLSFSGWTPSFEVQHFSEGHLEMRTIDVTARIAHTGYDLDLGRILADLRRLQIAHDTRWATLAMNLLGTGAGMLFPGLGGVLTATDVMISLFGFGTTTVELTEAQQGIFMRMFGSGGRFNMEGDTLSRLDGRFEGISFEGIYNPIVIRSLHGWQTEGLGSWLDEEHIDFRRINDERTRNELSGNDNALRLLDGGFTLGSGPNDMSAYEFLRAIDDIEKVINIDGSRGVNLTLLWSNNVLGN